ncbi:YqzK family protein [Alkalihalobacillus sp. CinArs1]|uniref:YqzK family protein n=1 Tax=Alkalihalobacillus sp. CinArs1 TaxID=2995314 RepID=UPI0022DDCA61|nr:YqzK family protein [Alkalihalobacillus sp. CinArs1]
MVRGLLLVLDTMKVFLLFTGCTLLFYFGILWVNQEYQNYHRYDEPEGKAVKVVQMESVPQQIFLERLGLFFQTGE